MSDICQIDGCEIRRNFLSPYCDKHTNEFNDYTPPEPKPSTEDSWPITKYVLREDYEAVINELNHCRIVEIPSQDEEIKQLQQENERLKTRCDELEAAFKQINGDIDSCKGLAEDDIPCIAQLAYEESETRIQDLEKSRKEWMKKSLHFLKGRNEFTEEIRRLQGVVEIAEKVKSDYEEYTNITYTRYEQIKEALAKIRSVKEQQ